jgi:uncharacterized protein YbgA (DUF1722 family)
VYPAKGGAAAKKVVGIFAREFMKAYALLPVEEEGRLHDPNLRESFIERIFVMQRWHELVNHKPKSKDLIACHTAHKYLMLAHSPEHYRKLGKLVAEVAHRDIQEVLNEYFELLITGCARHASPSKHQNVLLHILGYFKQELTTAEKQDLIELINQYKAGLIPLIVPVTLINHYVRKYDKEYLAGQIFLHPHPMELKLRNHV